MNQSKSSKVSDKLRVANQRVAYELCVAIQRVVSQAKEKRVVNQRVASTSHCEPTSWNSITLRTESQQAYELQAQSLMIRETAI